MARANGQLRLEITVEDRAIMPLLKAACHAIVWLAAPLLPHSSLERMISVLARWTVELGVRIDPR